MLGRSPKGVHPQLRSLEVFQDEAPRLLHEAKKSMSHFDNISVRWTTQLPQNLTWNLKITHQKRKRSQSVFLGFHVSFRGGGVTLSREGQTPLKKTRAKHRQFKWLWSCCKTFNAASCCVSILLVDGSPEKQTVMIPMSGAFHKKHRKYYYSCFTGDKWDNGIIIPPGK